MGDVLIRPMTIKDIDQVRVIERLSFTNPWSQKAFEDELQANDFAHYFVAVKDEKIVGYAGMWLILDEAHVTNIAVLPSCRGQGIGEKLTLQLIFEAVKRGADKITLEVRVSNLPAQRLYKKLGFSKMGIRKGYYTDNNEDAIIMWKTILPTEFDY